MTGFAVCGSFCTHARALSLMRALAKDGEILPILSDTAYTTDTRFGKADEFVHTVTEICGRAPIRTVAEAEPIGPLGMTDVMLIAPCTGNTLAKLAHGITDSSVTMAAKSHMRTSKPLEMCIRDSVEREFARALLRRAPTDTVRQTGDILDLQSLDPFPLFGDRCRTVMRTLGNAAHVFNFAGICNIAHLPLSPS